MNALAVRVQRPSKNNDMPYKNPNTELAFTFVDWAPNPPDGNAGIWREVSITRLDQGEPIIRYPVVNTKLIPQPNSNLVTTNLTVMVEVLSVGKHEKPQNGYVTVVINGKKKVTCQQEITL